MKMERKLWFVFLLFFIIVFLPVVATRAVAEGAVIWTDKPDYSPEEIATIYGSGFTANAEITVSVTRPDYSVDLLPYVSSDFSGNFSISYQLNGIMGIYTVTATDGTNTATTYFTDGVKTDLVQCKNDSNNNDVVDTPMCTWVTGNLGSSNSIFAEGNTPPPYPAGVYPGHVDYRLIFQDLAASSTYDLTISYEFTKGGVVAFDFLTTDYGVTDANLCDNRPSGLTSTECSNLVSGGASSYTFPRDTFALPAGLGGGTVQNRQDAHDTALAAYNPSKIKIYGANIDSIGAPVHTGSVTGDSTVSVTIRFTTKSGTTDVLISWAGHLGIGTSFPTGYGTGNGAGSITGSPFHMGLVSLKDSTGKDVSGGARDRSVSLGALLESIIIRKNTIGGDDTFSFTTTGGYGLPASFSITTSGGTGSQSFAVTKAPRSYTVTESTPPVGWILTSIVCVDPDGGSWASDSTAHIDLDSGQTVTCTFTDEKAASISGMKFEDKNADGDKTGDSGLGGWTVKLYKKSDSSWSYLRSTTTDSGGSYSFTDLESGTYRICEVLQTGWAQTLPTSGVSCPGSTFGYSVTVSSGGDVTGKDFGNVVPSSSVVTEIHLDPGHTAVTSVLPGSSVHDNATVTRTGANIPTDGYVIFKFYKNGGCSGTPDKTWNKDLTGGSAQEWVESGSVGPLALGSYSFKAFFYGCELLAQSACEVLTVEKAPTSIGTTVHVDGTTLPHTVVPLDGSVPLGTSVHDNATVTGQVGGPAVTGTVTYNFFKNGGCTGTPFSSSPPVNVGSESPSTGPLAAGSYSYNATYSGDGNYLPSKSACEPFHVGKAPTTTTTAVHNATHTDITDTTVPLATSGVHDNATVGPKVNGLDITGDVKYEFFNNGGCSDTASQSWTVAYGSESSPLGALAAGDYSFQATYLGDDNYAASPVSACEPFHVGKAPTTTTTAVHNATHTDITDTTVPLGSVVHDSATVSGQVNGFPITGTVTYNFFKNGACDGDPFSSEDKAVGSESSSTGSLAAGSYSYNAKYNGDGNYTASPVSACEPFRVEKAAGLGILTTILDANNNTLVGPVYVGDIVRDNATLLGGVNPTGSVTYRVFNDSACSVLVFGPSTKPLGSVSDPFTPLVPGTYQWIAEYSGDGNNQGVSGVCGDEPFTVIPITIETAQLTVIKHVINDNGGTLTAGSFKIRVKIGGVDVSGSPASGSESGTQYTLTPGTYKVSEDTPPSGYTRLSITGNCESDGTIILNSGDLKTCTITNDDLPPTVTVISKTPLAVIDPEFSGVRVGVDRSYYVTKFTVTLNGKHTFRAPTAVRINGVTYRFVYWQDENNAVVSRSATFTYNVQTSKTFYVVYRPPQFTLTVYVYDSTTRKPIAGATVRIDGGYGEVVVGMTDARGKVAVKNVYAGTYKLSISKDTYRNFTTPIDLTRSTLYKAYLNRLA